MRTKGNVSWLVARARPAQRACAKGKCILACDTIIVHAKGKCLLACSTRTIVAVDEWRMQKETGIRACSAIQLAGFCLIEFQVN